MATSLWSFDHEGELPPDDMERMEREEDERRRKNLEDALKAQSKDFRELGDVTKSYSVIGKIGEGGYSSVYKAISKGQLVALKLLNGTTKSSQVIHEAEIIRTHGGAQNRTAELRGVGVHHDVERERHTLVLAHFDHTPFDQLIKTAVLDDVRHYMRSLLLALAHLHSHGIIHRDIKPSNFLYNVGRRSGRLIDFGLAEFQFRPRPEVARATARAGIAAAGGAVKKKGLKKRVGGAAPTALLAGKRAGGGSAGTKRLSADGGGAGARLQPPRSGDGATEEGARRGLPRPRAATCAGGGTLQARSLATANDAPSAAASATPPSRGAKAAIAAAVAGGAVAQPPAAPNASRPLKPLAAAGAAGRARAGVGGGGAGGGSLPARVRAAKAGAGGGAGGKAGVAGGKGSALLPEAHYNRAGTKGFRAPEVLLREARQTVAIDVWSAGVVLASFLTGRCPFFPAPDDVTAILEVALLLGAKKMRAAQASTGHSVNVEEILRSHKEPPLPFPSLIRALVGADAARRLRAEDLSDGVLDLLERMLEPDARRRITAREALSHPFLAGGDEEEAPPPPEALAGGALAPGCPAAAPPAARDAEAVEDRALARVEHLRDQAHRCEAERAAGEGRSVEAKGRLLSAMERLQRLLDVKRRPPGTSEQEQQCIASDARDEVKAAMADEEMERGAASDAATALARVQGELARAEDELEAARGAVAAATAAATAATTAAAREEDKEREEEDVGGAPAEGTAAAPPEAYVVTGGGQKDDADEDEEGAAGTEAPRATQGAGGAGGGGAAADPDAEGARAADGGVAVPAAVQEGGEQQSGTWTKEHAPAAAEPTGPAVKAAPAAAAAATSSSVTPAIPPRPRAAPGNGGGFVAFLSSAVGGEFPPPQMLEVPQMFHSPVLPAGPHEPMGRATTHATPPPASFLPSQSPPWSQRPGAPSAAKAKAKAEAEAEAARKAQSDEEMRAMQYLNKTAGSGEGGAWSGGAVDDDDIPCLSSPVAPNLTASQEAAPAAPQEGGGGAHEGAGSGDRAAPGVFHTRAPLSRRGTGRAAANPRSPPAGGGPPMAGRSPPGDARGLPRPPPDGDADLAARLAREEDAPPLPRPRRERKAPRDNFAADISSAEMSKRMRVFENRRADYDDALEKLHVALEAAGEAGVGEEAMAAGRAAADVFNAAVASRQHTGDEALEAARAAAARMQSKASAARRSRPARRPATATAAAEDVKGSAKAAEKLAALSPKSRGRPTARVADEKEGGAASPVRGTAAAAVAEEEEEEEEEEEDEVEDAPPLPRPRRERKAPRDNFAADISSAEMSKRMRVFENRRADYDDALEKLHMALEAAGEAGVGEEAMAAGRAAADVFNAAVASRQHTGDEALEAARAAAARMQSKASAARRSRPARRPATATAAAEDVKGSAKAAEKLAALSPKSRGRPTARVADEKEGGAASPVRGTAAAAVAEEEEEEEDEVEDAPPLPRPRRERKAPRDNFAADISSTEMSKRMRVFENRRADYDDALEKLHVALEAAGEAGVGEEAMAAGRAAADVFNAAVASRQHTGDEALEAARAAAARMQSKASAARRSRPARRPATATAAAEDVKGSTKAAEKLAALSPKSRGRPTARVADEKEGGAASPVRGTVAQEEEEEEEGKVEDAPPLPRPRRERKAPRDNFAADISSTEMSKRMRVFENRRADYDDALEKLHVALEAAGEAGVGEEAMAAGRAAADVFNAAVASRQHTGDEALEAARAAAARMQSKASAARRSRPARRPATATAAAEDVKGSTKAAEKLAALSPKSRGRPTARVADEKEGGAASPVRGTVAQEEEEEEEEGKVEDAPPLPRPRRERKAPRDNFAADISSTEMSKRMRAFLIRRADYDDALEKLHVALEAAGEAGVGEDAMAAGRAAADVFIAAVASRQHTGDEALEAARAAAARMQSEAGAAIQLAPPPFSPGDDAVVPDTSSEATDAVADTSEASLPLPATGLTPPQARRAGAEVIPDTSEEEEEEEEEEKEGIFDFPGPPSQQHWAQQRASASSPAQHGGPSAAATTPSTSPAGAAATLPSTPATEGGEGEGGARGVKRRRPSAGGGGRWARSKHTVSKLDDIYGSHRHRQPQARHGHRARGRGGGDQI